MLRAFQKRPGVLLESAMCLYCKEGKRHPGLQAAEHCQQRKGNDSSLPLSTAEAMPDELRMQFWLLSYKGGKDLLE